MDIILSKQCIRRVGGKRCSQDKVRGMVYCGDHLKDTCVVCSKAASLECVDCNKPLCGTCKHHDSFGH